VCTSSESAGIKNKPIIILERARALVSWNDKEGLKWYLCFFPAQRYDPLHDPVWSPLSSITHAYYGLEKAKDTTLDVLSRIILIRRIAHVPVL